MDELVHFEPTENEVCEIHLTCIFVFYLIPYFAPTNFSSTYSLITRQYCYKSNYSPVDHSKSIQTRFPLISIQLENQEFILSIVVFHLLLLLLLLLFVHQHIIVFCGGNIYILPVTNSKGKYLSTLDLEGQYEWIQADAKHSGGENSPE